MNGGFLRTGRRLAVSCAGVLLTTCYHPPHKRTPDWDLAPGEERPDRMTAQQLRALAVPESPDSFSPDAGVKIEREPAMPVFEIESETTVTEDAPLPPTEFNPDPGMGATKAGAMIPSVAADESAGFGRFFKDDLGLGDDRFFRRDAGVPKEFPKFTADIREDMTLPRSRVTRSRVEIGRAHV